MTHKKLAIVASGDLGQLIAYHASANHLFEIAGFYDDFKTKNDKVNGFTILGSTQDLLPDFEKHIYDEVMIAIGYKHFEIRKKIFNYCLEHKIKLGTLIHPNSYIDKSCIVGEGSFILPGCVLDRNVEIGKNVLINTACAIAHDSKIGAHTFLSPRVSIAGFVNIGECCNIGINTTVIDNISIADYVQTGGGTVVIKNLQNSGLYVGNPQRFVR